MEIVIILIEISQGVLFRQMYSTHKSVLYFSKIWEKRQIQKVKFHQIKYLKIFTNNEFFCFVERFSAWEFFLWQCKAVIVFLNVLFLPILIGFNKQFPKYIWHDFQSKWWMLVLKIDKWESFYYILCISKLSQIWFNQNFLRHFLYISGKNKITKRNLPKIRNILSMKTNHKFRFYFRMVKLTFLFYEWIKMDFNLMLEVITFIIRWFGSDFFMTFIIYFDAWIRHFPISLLNTVGISFLKRLVKV